MQSTVISSCTGWSHCQWHIQTLHLHHHHHCPHHRQFLTGCNVASSLAVTRSHRHHQHRHIRHDWQSLVCRSVTTCLCLHRAVTLHQEVQVLTLTTRAALLACKVSTTLDVLCVYNHDSGLSLLITFECWIATTLWTKKNTKMFFDIQSTIPDRLW